MSHIPPRLGTGPPAGAHWLVPGARHPCCKPSVTGGSVSVVTPLRVLRSELELARSAGVAFDDAWETASDALRTLLADWQDVLTSTRDGWRAAYERRPAVRAELALGAVAQDTDREPLAADLELVDAGWSIRQQAGLSLDAMAELAGGVSRKAIRRWELGEVRPHSGPARRYARALDAVLRDLTPARRA